MKSIPDPRGRNRRKGCANVGCKPWRKLLREGRPDVGRQQDASPGAADVECREDIGRDGEVGEDGEEELDGEAAEKITDWLVGFVPALGGNRRGFAARGKERPHLGGVVLRLPLR